MFKPVLRNYFYPFVGRILFWNAILFIFVKLLLPQSAFQLASFLNTVPAFDSREVIKLTNNVRSSNNLAVLKANSQLDVAAEEKLNNMATEEYFAHISPSGITPWFWIEKSNYRYSIAGENLAIGFLTAHEAVDAWMNSPSHRANLLNNKYKEIGVAVKGVEINGQEGILVVQMFGTSSARPAASAPKKTTPPVSVVSVSPVAGVTQKAQTAGETITVQYATTETTEPPVTKPTVVEFKDTENAKELSSLINRGFSIYLLIVVIFSMITYFVFEKSRAMALKTSFSMALVILSLVIPATDITLKGLVF